AGAVRPGVRPRQAASSSLLPARQTGSGLDHLTGPANLSARGLGPVDAVAKGLASSRPGSSPAPPAKPGGTPPPRPVAGRPAGAEDPPAPVMPRPRGAAPVAAGGFGQRSDNVPGCPTAAHRPRTLGYLARRRSGASPAVTARAARPGSGQSGRWLQRPGADPGAPASEPPAPPSLPSAPAASIRTAAPAPAGGSARPTGPKWDSASPWTGAR